MFHAFLHHKLDELIPEPQRREDTLTSTVFGTLVLVNAWNTLAHWLNMSDEDSTSPAGVFSNDCWFWPRLAFAEPDVVLRLGSVLFVVEAKYQSSRNDLVPTEDEGVDLCDQLVRQHRSIKEPVENRARYAEQIEHAITECKLVQVFVVDARRHRRAGREWEESKRRLPPEANLRMVTWQHLFRLLNGAELRKNRWAIELRSYLKICGLDTFEGVDHQLAEPRLVRAIRDWRHADDYRRWQNAMVGILTARMLASLESWRSPTRKTSTGPWNHHIDPRVINRAKNAIAAWRITPHDQANRRSAEQRRSNR